MTNYEAKLARHFAHLGFFTLLLPALVGCRFDANTNEGYQPMQLAGCWQSDIVETEWGPMYNEFYFDSAGAFVHYLYGQELGSWSLIAKREGRADRETGRLIYESQRTGIEETFYQVQGRNNLELRYRNYQEDLDEIIRLTRCPKGKETGSDPNTTNLSVK